MNNNRYWLVRYTDIKKKSKSLLFNLDTDSGDEAYERADEFIPEPYIDFKFYGSQPKYSVERFRKEGVKVID